MDIKEIDWALQIVIMASESKSFSTILKWGGKQTSADMYMLKLEALLEYHNSGDAIDKVTIQNFPMTAQYNDLGIDGTRSIRQASLYCQKSGRVWSW